MAITRTQTDGDGGQAPSVPEAKKKQQSAALQIMVAVAECIRELGETPSGPIYASLMGRITFAAYESIIGTLKRTGLVTESPAHLLTWIGPAKGLRA